MSFQPRATAPASAQNRFNPLIRLAVVTVLTGIGAGLGGMSLALLLRAVQHLAYGYSLDTLSATESFLQGVSGASPERRVLVLTVCGLIAGFGWLAVSRFGTPLVSIKQALSNGGQRMPVVSTLAHAVLQIVTVAMGSPLGREVAPREVGALVGGWLAHYAGLGANERRLIVACGAGAGLAAVYNVPLGGAVFVLEVLLGTFSATAVVIALTTSVIGALVAWIGLGDETQYLVPHFALSKTLVIWAVLTGPIFGIAAWSFARLTNAARVAAPRSGWQLPALTLANFVMVGMLVAWLPQLAGNGKGPAQLGFDNALTIGVAGTLLLMKLLIVTTSLRAGAQGGLLTPGLTIGALFAIVLGGVWSMMWPGVAPGAFAIVGAAAFLATSMNMPVTAIVLVAEFTRIDHDLLIPVLCAVAGSICASRLCEMAVASNAQAAGKPSSKPSGKPESITAPVPDPSTVSVGNAVGTAVAQRV
ncbi:chloride channel protein [Paraburkholderia sp.]|uniref:chloride channel protein n=1 Tax=Paraburkholderia sp. TaxID=1926495 RepID=UPI00239A3D54|nr:chloride channel protein [Paraburkholderia sp.]MDE1184721.1 chloride channel protein [Paraburkholderia sp.]